MNSEQYLNYLQESQHIALESYKYIGEMYDSYTIYNNFQEVLQLMRDEKIDEIITKIPFYIPKNKDLYKSLFIIIITQLI